MKGKAERRSSIGRIGDPFSFLQWFWVMQAPCSTTALAIVSGSCSGRRGAGAQGRYGLARKNKMCKSDIHLTSFPGHFTSDTLAGILCSRNGLS